MEGQDYLKGAINVRDPPRRGDRKICREHTVAIRTEIVSRSKRTKFKNHSSRISPRKGFLALNLSFFTFLISLIHCAYWLIHCACWLIHWGLAFKPTYYKFFVLGSLGLNPFIFWAREPKSRPYIIDSHLYIYIFLLFKKSCKNIIM